MRLTPVILMPFLVRALVYARLFDLVLLEKSDYWLKSPTPYSIHRFRISLSHDECTYLNRQQFYWRLLKWPGWPAWVGIPKVLPEQN